MKKSVFFLILILFVGSSVGVVACGDDSGGGEKLCGNGILDGEEECDGEELGEADCISLGFLGGTLSCDSDCHFDTSDCSSQAECGNGIVESPEECDGADLGGQTCADLGLEVGDLSCTSTCQFDTSSCTGNALCGDGTRQYPEDCDGSDLSGKNCSSLGYEGGTLECSEDCTFDTSFCTSGGECGNGTIDTDEECDGDNLNGQTCASLGQGFGNLTCSSSCSFDTSGCSGPDYLLVSAPNGGEVLNSFEDFNISWTSTNTTGSVDIFYSIDGGTTYLPIATEETDDGLYAWSVPNTPSTTCLVKIQKSSGSPRDTSDAVFEIAPPSSSGVWYVDADATGANNGTNWTDAFAEIQDAMTAASTGDEIWVAEGTYLPQSGDTVLLTLKEDISLFGGFTGTETQREDRDPSAHVTVLDGNHTAQHVVVGASGSLISGFSIINGLASGTSPHDKGAGMLNDSVTGLFVDQCLFGENEAAASGGGMHNVASVLTLSNCTFEGNTAGNGGGGMSNEDSSPYIIHTTFSDNEELGGGFAGAFTTYTGHPVLEGCTFSGNSGYNGGALYADSGSLILKNSIFYDNYAEVFGGVMLNGGANVTILNCTLTQNIGHMYGGALSTFGGPYTIINSILWDNEAPLGKEIHSGSNSASVSYSNIDQSEGFIDEGGNFTGHPNFQDPSTGDFRLGQGSPCIDAGDGDSAPGTDKDGNPRLDDSTVTDNGTGSPTYSDVGAYEFLGDSDLVLTSPNGGENWSVGDDRQITWTAVSGISNVKIEVSRDSGVTWSEVVASTPASTGSFTWTLTGPGTPQALIRISDASDSSVWDLSDHDFWILSNDIIYVDISATGSDDGSSWANAYTSIVDAMAASAFGDELWVAQGTYTRQGGASEVIVLAQGRTLYGGFPSGGSPLSDRDPGTYPTTLDGQDAVEHVVIAENYATLDGFIITGGNANGAWPHGGSGGGLFIDNVSPYIQNCTFTGNSADSSGGAIYMVGEGASPLITNCTFDGNTADNGGGCLYFSQSSSPHITQSLFTHCSSNSFGGAINGSGSSSPFPTLTLEDCSFIDNSGHWGGGVSLTNLADSTAITGCTFEGNAATTAYGGGLYLSNTSATVTDTLFTSNSANDTTSGRGGGVSQYGNSSSTFINCVFAENSSGGDNRGGGGLQNQGSTDATLINCSFGNNTVTGAGASGGAIFHTDGSLTLTNCILWGDTAPTDNEIHIAGSATPVITYSNVEGGPSGSDGNLSSDPLYVGGTNLHLGSGSPCIDAANGDEAPTLDVEENARVDIASVPNSGTGTIDYVDMGAYERTTP